MPRPIRQIIPNVPLHITQRGVDRWPTFLTDDDFAYYRWALDEARLVAGCAVHAYALMTNHVHLLVTPNDADGPARLMISLGRRFVRYFNESYRRTGTLWEGRYRSAIVDSVPYLFACSRYIEMNPTRAGLVADPGAYDWSSHRRNAFGDEDPLITEHASYTALGETPDARCAAYRAMFSTDFPTSTVAAVRAEQRARPTPQPTSHQQAVAAMFGRQLMPLRSDGTGAPSWYGSRWTASRHAAR